jgi:hypothetical protein
MAGNTFIRSMFGAGFVVFATAMYNNLGIAWASSLLAFLGCAFLPIPFFLFRVRALLQLVLTAAEYCSSTASELEAKVKRPTMMS